MVISLILHLFEPKTMISSDGKLQRRPLSARTLLTSVKSLLFKGVIIPVGRH